MVLQIIRIRCESAFFRNQNTIVVHVQWTTGPPWISCPAPPLIVHGRKVQNELYDSLGTVSEPLTKDADGIMIGSQECTVTGPSAFSN